MKKIRTNKLILNIDFQKLDEKYEIFKITTSDKYISQGSYLLDIPSLKLKSIFYAGKGNSLYLLANKNDDLFQQIKNYVSNQPNSDKLSIEKIYLRNEKYPHYIAGNLFLNSLNNGNINDFKFNNLTGKLYCFGTGKDFIEKRKDRNQKTYISRITALQIKIDCNMFLCLDVKTFTNYRLKENIDFSHSKTQKNWNSYPQYTISKPYNFLKRVMPIERKSTFDMKETFILREIRNDKKSIPFLKIDSLKNFSQSKIGLLYYTMDLFNNNYSDIIKIDFQTINDYVSLEPKSNQTQLKDLKSNIHNQVISMGIRVIDCIQDEQSKLIVDKLTTILKNDYNIMDLEVSYELSKDKLNLKLVHEGKDYSKNYQIDPYSNDKNYIIQHTTDKIHEELNDYLRNKKENKDKSNPMLENILKELIIKKDLIQNKISLIDWSKYNYQKDWIFGLKDDDLFYFIIIHPNGSFEFKTIEDNPFSITGYQKCINFINSNDVNGIIVNSDNDINFIRKTNQFTIPEFEQIHNMLYTLKDNSLIKVCDLLEYINEFENSPQFRKNHVDDLSILKNYFQNSDTIQCNDLRKILDKSHKPKAINRTIEKFINNKVYEDYNISLFHHLREKLERDLVLSSETDIKYFELNDKKYYFVGYTGTGMNTTLTTSCRIREISTIDNGKIFFKELLPLMDVVFVKYGQLTVTPFPFKYLREYINQQK